MNALGLEYASSSDEEDAQAAPTTASTVSTSAVDASADAEPVASSQTPAESADSDEIRALEGALLRFGVPPAPSAQADAKVQERIATLLEAQRERGEDFQTSLHARKEVRNPYILDKVVEYFGIDEMQSNFDVSKFDPHALPLHEFVDALALEHRKRDEARMVRQYQAHLQMQHTALDAEGPRRLQFVSRNE